MDNLIPHSARPEEYRSALELLFQSYDDEERWSRIANALELLRNKELDPEGLFVLRSADGLTGTLLCSTAPGAVGILWPPQCQPHENQQLHEDRLLEGACAWLREKRTKLAQALLAPEEASLGASLLRHGFQHITRLLYLQHDLALQPRASTKSPHVTYRCYDENPKRFHQTLLASYVDTRDFPELDGVRSLEEIVEGHQSHGVFDPKKWWLAYLDDRPLGVAVVAELPGEGCWELAYLGILPEHRRRGYARAMMQRLLAEARRSGCANVTLSVDERNGAARALYADLGFLEYDVRDVYLLVWR